VPLYALLITAVNFVSGYYTKTKPNALSESTIIAVQNWLRGRMPKP
jgi:ABC-type transporter Mla maintaining outer membrane lipid asymmetry permease subunit MlaE